MKRYDYVFIFVIEIFMFWFGMFCMRSLTDHSHKAYTKQECIKFLDTLSVK